MDEKILYYIWLSNTFRAGSTVPKLLLSHFNSIFDIYNASKEDYEALSLSKADCIKLCNKDLTLARTHFGYCKAAKIGFICYDEPYYPERLKIIDSPPPLFYYRGRLNNLDDLPCITMVGTRSCSERGFRHAYSIAFDAASKGAVIVNGLAAGIDGACISGALDANGYAVGVLGCGIDRIYPDENKELFHRLSASGLIITEFAPFTPPEGKNFPVRNRVISGLSCATCIFEANAKGSGAMITAEHAENQGRPIFAVPGKPYDKTYSGALELIKNGAAVFTEADDVLSEYSMNFPHRINLANKNPVPNDKLDLLVSKYFKKGTDPDVPVNRRHIPQRRKTTEAPDKALKSTPQDVFAQNRRLIEAVTPYKESEISEQEIDAPKASPKKPEINKETKESSAPVPGNVNSIDLSVLSSEEMQIYEIFRKEGKSLTANEIASHGLKIEQVLSVLTLLEIYNIIEACPGGRYKIKTN